MEASAWRGVRGGECEAEIVGHVMITVVQTSARWVRTSELPRIPPIPATMASATVHVLHGDFKWPNENNFHSQPQSVFV